MFLYFTYGDLTLSKTAASSKHIKIVTLISYNSKGKEVLTMAEINLWNETINVLHAHGKSWDEVAAVCRNTYVIPKTCFEKIALPLDYDNGYGNHKIPIDLKIISEDRSWWMERCEYDGKEWWAFKSCPEVPETIKTIETIDEDGLYPL